MAVAASLSVSNIILMEVNASDGSEGFCVRRRWRTLERARFHPRRRGRSTPASASSSSVDARIVRLRATRGGIDDVPNPCTRQEKPKINQHNAFFRFEREDLKFNIFFPLPPKLWQLLTLFSFVTIVR